MAKKILVTRKILVVDDEPHIVRILQDNLESAGYEVVTASNGKDALEKVKQETPTIVVLDSAMPNMDGLAVLKIFWRNPPTRELPVVMLMSDAAEANVFKGWQSGIDGYLTKPVDLLKLNGLVKRMFAAMDDDYDAEKTGYTVFEWNIS